MKGPTADFSASPEVGAAPLKVQFTNASTGATNYLWSFGDGTGSTSTQLSPSYIFNNIGEFAVELTATNAEGCEIKRSKSIKTITPLPDVDLKLITASENADGTLKIIITIHNKGNTFLYNLPVVIDISGNVSLTETIAGPIAPAAMYNLILSYSIIKSANVKFLCAATALENDLTPESNRICKEFENEVLLFTTHPNPVGNTLNVEWIAPVDQKVDILLTDSYGREVAQAQIVSIEGLNKISVDVSKFQSGIYFLKITGGKTVKTERILISPKN